MYSTNLGEEKGKEKKRRGPVNLPPSARGIRSVMNGFLKNIIKDSGSEIKY
jgi:hypothetical protein